MTYKIFIVSLLCVLLAACHISQIRFTSMRDDIFGIRDYGRVEIATQDQQSFTNFLPLERIKFAASVRCLSIDKRARLIKEKCGRINNNICVSKDYIFECY